jgi:hypothetical protein
MTDINSKVLFYPLERLDLVDLRGVQDLAHNALSSYIGAVATAKSGVVNSWASVSFDTVNHRIEFADFTALGRLYDVDGNTSYYPAYLLKFNALDSANGDCSYDTARAAAQAYFNSNGSLPPAPTDEAYNLSVHGEYYPYIYCRPVVSAGESEVRRFWSLADARESTDTVDTRSTTSVEFSLVSPTQAPSAGGDYAWIRIAQVTAWSVSAGAVEISAITEEHLADRLLELDDNRTVAGVKASVASQDGLDRAVKYLQERVQDLLANGTEDAALAPSYTNYELPRLSLSGLDYEFSRRAQRLEQHSLSGTYLLTSTIDAGAGTDTVTISSGFSASPFTVTAYRDYELLTTDYRIGGLSYPIAVADYTARTLHLAKAAYSLFIALPQSLEGYALQVTATPVALVDYAQDMSGISTANISNGSYLSNTWHILQGSTTTAIHKISATHNAKDANGDTYSATGFRLVGSCAYTGDTPQGIHLSSEGNPVPLVYKLKLDIRVINPNTYGGL